MDLQEREKENPNNVIEVSDTVANNELLESMINENSESINWEKALPMTKYEGKAPPIIIDNIEEVTMDNIDETIMDNIDEAIMDNMDEVIRGCSFIS